MTMNRRTLLKRAGALATGAVLPFASTQGRAQDAPVLTGVSYLPPSYADLTYGSQGFVDLVNQEHGDTVKLDFYDSGRLLAADEQLPALRSGNIDFMFHTTSYITRSLPILGITGLPGVVGPLYENPDRIKRGSPLHTLIADELRKNGLTLLTLGGGVMEPEYIWSTDSGPIRSLQDLKGKRVRVVSFEATKAMEDFGAASVRIPSSELYIALQRGTVEAAVANISTINGRSINEQVTHVYRMPVTGFGIGLFFANKRWDSLADPVKEAVLEGVDWFDAESAKVANVDYFEGRYWPAYKEQGMEIIEPSEEELAEFDKTSVNVREAWLDDVGREVGEKAIALALGESN